MKKLSVFSAFFCLLLTAGAVFAQEKATNFAGIWELDVSKSKLPERSRLESMTLNVAQTEKELKVRTSSKRAARPEGQAPTDAGSEIRQGNGGGRSGMSVLNGVLSYNLDGKEHILEVEAYAAMPPTTTQPKAESLTLQAKTEMSGALKLVSTRSFDTPNGAMNIKTTENWELLDGGKALKVMRETASPRGTQNSEMYFTKRETVSGSDNSAGGMGAVSRKIAGGVLNGKALQLTKPGYPAEARESKASGAVNVQVEIDELGNVVSAKAVSGNEMLRAASEEAARNSKFAPTMLSGVPVKVTGIIVYNFVAP